MSYLRELAEKAFQDGQNVSRVLRNHLGISHNTAEVIEIAYDLQAGSYVQSAMDNREFILDYAAQLAMMLNAHMEPRDTLLDAGTGEMTTLSHTLAAMKRLPAKVYACDISERRLEIGKAYAAKHIPSVDLGTLRAELSSLPLRDNSVDVITTNHAIEPNGGREKEVLAELLRVARRKLVLFEPCYELASEEGKERMRGHGYIRGLAQHARNLGASVDGPTSLPLVANHLNPTACFIVSCVTVK